MSYLLRVELPDVPGSLGRLATAIGAVGANIDAIEIVGKDPATETATDDVFVAADGIMPDTIVSAVQALEGVRVLWISRYAAGSNLFLDLEAVEQMTEAPAEALVRLVESTPAVFRVDWGLLIGRTEAGLEIRNATPAAPANVPDGVAWPPQVGRAAVITGANGWSDLTVAAAPASQDEWVVVGRRGGPAFLDSELARLAHLVSLAASLTA